MLCLIAVKTELCYNVFMAQIVNDDIQDLAVQAGSMILENGGETYRAEETAVSVAKSLSAEEAHSFVTPTVVILSWKNRDGRHFMNMNRIVRRGTNLKKLALVNDLSRKIEWLGRVEKPEELRQKFSQIQSTPEYPSAFSMLAAAVSSFFFALMFGGTLVDGITAFVIGFVLRLVTIILEKRLQNTFIMSLLQGFVIAILATGYARFNQNLNIDITMISALMIVVPGITLVTAIRDVIAGDLMAGTARLVEALMIAAGLSIGAVGGFLLLGTASV